MYSCTKHKCDDTPLGPSFHGTSPGHPAKSPQRNRCAHRQRTCAHLRRSFAAAVRRECVEGSAALRDHCANCQPASGQRLPVGRVRRARRLDHCNELVWHLPRPARLERPDALQSGRELPIRRLETARLRKLLVPIRSREPRERRHRQFAVPIRHREARLSRRDTGTSGAVSVLYGSNACVQCGGGSECAAAVGRRGHSGHYTRPAAVQSSIYFTLKRLELRETSSSYVIKN